MRTLPHLVAIVSLSASAVACGPSDGRVPTEEGKRFGKALCDAVVTCGCVTRIDTVDACAEITAERFDDAYYEGALPVGDCFESVIDELDTDPCASLSVLTPEGNCTALQGEKATGEGCEKHLDLAPLSVSECAEGLFCHDGTCVDDAGIPDKDVGDRCASDDAFSCGGALYCGDDERCHAMVGVGQACYDPRGCLPIGVTPSFCKGIGAGSSGICTEQAALGEACEPLDYYTCSLTPDAEFAWCNPATSLCEEGPDICISLTSPFTWP